VCPTDSGQETLRFPGIPIFAQYQPQPIFDKGGEGAAFRGGFASRESEEVLEKSDCGALCHMSRLIAVATICHAAT